MLLPLHLNLGSEPAPATSVVTSRSPIGIQTVTPIKQRPRRAAAHHAIAFQTTTAATTVPAPVLNATARHTITTGPVARLTIFKREHDDELALLLAYDQHPHQTEAALTGKRP